MKRLQRVVRALSGFGCLSIFSGLAERTFGLWDGSNGGISAALSHAGAGTKKTIDEEFSERSAPKLHLDLIGDNPYGFRLFFAMSDLAWRCKELLGAF